MLCCALVLVLCIFSNLCKLILFTFWKNFLRTSLLLSVHRQCLMLLRCGSVQFNLHVLQLLLVDLLTCKLSTKFCVKELPLVDLQWTWLLLCRLERVNNPGKLSNKASLVHTIARSAVMVQVSPLQREESSSFGAVTTNQAQRVDDALQSVTIVILSQI